MIRNSNDETNFPHKLLLTYTQVSKIRKDFADDSSATIKFAQLGGSLAEALVGIPYVIAREGAKQLRKLAPEITRGLTMHYVNKK